MSQDELIKLNLEGITSEDVPSVDLKQRIAYRVKAEGERRSRKMITPLVILSLMLLTALAVTATVYATGSGLGNLFQMDSRLKKIDTAKMGKQLDLSQTQNGVTAKLVWVYADNNRVLIQFSIKTANGKRFDPEGLQLKDKMGTIYPFDYEYGVTGHSDLFAVDLPPGQGNYLASFSLPTEMQIGQDLSLVFCVDTSELIIPTDDSSKSSTNEAKIPSTVMIKPIPVGERVGPFEFHFTVQINP
jgi:hypothetical protein